MTQIIETVPPPFPIPPNKDIFFLGPDGAWRFGISGSNPCWISIQDPAWRVYMTRIAAEGWRTEASTHPGTDYEDLCKDNAEKCEWYGRSE